jgi:hypothetical protein
MIQVAIQKAKWGITYSKSHRNGPFVSRYTLIAWWSGYIKHSGCDTLFCDEQNKQTKHVGHSKDLVLLCTTEFVQIFQHNISP